MERAALIIVIALGTYATRIIGFTMLDRSRIPPRLDKGLSYVPVAAFAALIVPGLSGDGGLEAGRLGAAFFAAAAVLLTRQLWVALLTGMAVFWLL